MLHFMVFTFIQQQLRDYENTHVSEVTVPLFTHDLHRT